MRIPACLPSLGRRLREAWPASARLSLGAKRIGPAGGAAMAALLLPAILRPLPRIVWNVSPSVPLGLYRIVPSAEIRRGTLVALRPTIPLARFMARRRYVEAGALLLKPVAAVAGQTVCRTGARVTIDGRLAAVARAADRAGRPLPVWRGCRRLLPGTIFLLAPAMPTSFDGRYFGPVSTDLIVGAAVPLWVRP